MIGIEEIASYIPETRVSNIDRKEKYDTDEDFIKNKIGITHVALKDHDDDTSDMAIKAFIKLEEKTDINREEIEVLIVVTQNPDKNIPHTSAIVHGALGLPERCATFDISLGCSGFVYGLSTIASFMESNNFSRGVLITCDPYSKILNPEDKNTSLLFGDAATATYVTDQARFGIGNFTFGTIGKEWDNLFCEDDLLTMNGRGIFNFAAKYIPVDVKVLLEKNQLGIDEIDRFIFHQGSKYIIDTIARRLKLDTTKVSIDIMEYGNTVSSSIPIILEKEMLNSNNQNILISGFGVGLSWASCVLKKIN